MAGKKRGQAGVKQPGSMQFFSHGVTAGQLKERIREFAREKGITDMNVAAARYFEHLAVDKDASGGQRATYARGVARARVYVLGHKGVPGSWPQKREGS